MFLEGGNVMTKVDDLELKNVNGGVLRVAGKWAIIGAVVTFGIGFLSGWMRPSTCSSGN